MLLFRTFFFLALVVRIAQNMQYDSTLRKIPAKCTNNKWIQLIVKGVSSPLRHFYAKLKLKEGFCGAAIISQRFAVTAAHCVFQARSKSCSFFSKNTPIPYCKFCWLILPDFSTVFCNIGLSKCQLEKIRKTYLYNNGTKFIRMNN